MRVLFLTPYYRPAHLGGIERVVERLAAALARQPGMERPALLCTHYAFPPRYVPGLAAREILAGLEVFRLASWPHTPAPLFPYYSCPVTLFSPGEVGRVLRAYRPDVVHIVGDGWIWAHLAVLARRDRRTAVVFTPSFHDLGGSRAWMRWPYTFMCRHVERIVVLSRVEYRAVAQAYRPRRSDLAIVPWGATVPEREPDSRRDDRGDKPLILLCVGRLGRHKGQTWLLDIYLRARPQFTRATRLVLVGADEGDAGGRAALERRIAARGLGDEVALAGEVADAELRDLYDAADLFVLFSRYEAFGLVYVEAMAHGVPVLSHAVGATAEVLAQGGVVVPPYDADAAVDAMVSLINDDARRQRLGDDARAFVARTYSWDVVAARYRRIYEEAIDERRG